MKKFSLNLVRGMGWVTATLGEFMIGALMIGTLMIGALMIGTLGLVGISTAYAEEDKSNGLLSAFFGLDNALPFRANMLCFGASGKDGMPVVFAQTLDAETLQAEDFQVVTQAGAEYSPDCVTLRPAQDPGELRTVLLIGEFGNASEDPPRRVRIIGDIHADDISKTNFRGAHVDVTPLSAGPGLVFAEMVPNSEWGVESRGTTCPVDSQQILRVTWAGGVRLPNRDEAGDLQRSLYQVAVERDDGSQETIAPMALADLGDGDNNHLLCLDTLDAVLSVRFPAGHFVDPNQDLNPATQIFIQPSANPGVSQ